MGTTSSKNSDAQEAKEYGIKLGKLLIDREINKDNRDKKYEFETKKKELEQNVRNLFDSVQKDGRLNNIEKKDRKTNLKIIISKEAFKYILKYFNIKQKDFIKLKKTQEYWNVATTDLFKNFNFTERYINGAYARNTNYKNVKDDVWIKNIKNEIYEDRVKNL